MRGERLRHPALGEPEQRRCQVGSHDRRGVLTVEDLILECRGRPRGRPAASRRRSRAATRSPATARSSPRRHSSTNSTPPRRNESNTTVVNVSIVPARSSWFTGRPHDSAHVGAVGGAPGSASAGRLTRGSWSISQRTAACMSRTCRIRSIAEPPGSNPPGSVTSMRNWAVSLRRRSASVSSRAVNQSTCTPLAAA